MSDQNYEHHILQIPIAGCISNIKKVNVNYHDMLVGAGLNLDPK
jgi:hypothetical protein